MLLLEHGAYANATSANGATPLFLACDHGAFGLLPLLLTHGAEPNRAGPLPEGLTPLGLCAMYGELLGATNVLRRNPGGGWHGGLLDATGEAEEYTRFDPSGHAQTYWHFDISRAEHPRKFTVDSTSTYCPFDCGQELGARSERY